MLFLVYYSEICNDSHKVIEKQCVTDTLAAKKASILGQKTTKRNISI